LASGSFGAVFCGKLQGRQLIALKQLQEETNLQEFEKEVTIMKSLRHPNIVQFFGIYVSSIGEQFMAMEFMDLGDLKSYLGKKRSLITLQHCISMIQDIAAGMEYLAHQNLVHRDLAARNLLVCSNHTNNNFVLVKIADFGLTRTNNYELNSQSQISFAWAAPEVLNRQTFSTKSDIFSFGVTIWEIMSLGEDPWNMNNREAKQKVLAGERLISPFGCPNQLYELMLLCWKEDVELRPTFAKFLMN